MSKKQKNTFPESEYSISFNRKNDDGSQSLTPVLRKNEKINHSSNANDKKVHQFRHKLKLALLEKLEKLESRYLINQSSLCDQISNNNFKKHRRKHSEKREVNSPVSTYGLCTGKTNLNRCTKNQKIHSYNADEWQQELRRSRSLALEFKLKNESTQIWWLNEPVDMSSDDSCSCEDFLMKSINKEHLKTKLPLQPKQTICSRKMSPKKVPLMSMKVLPPEQSPSTLSRSSFSYQIAQATGYQSTTDDWSSFNHDTDVQSIDPNGYKHHTAGSESPNIVSNKSKNKDLNLDLSMKNRSRTPSSLNHPLVFHLPYQTEDFVKDTSSDSNVNSLNNCDTYRLD